MQNTVFSTTEIALIEAFLALADEIGVSNITLQKVAKRAKVAFGTVRYYFAGKERLDLTQAAIIYIFQIAQRQTEDFLYRARNRSNYNGIKAYIDGTFEWISNKNIHAEFLLYFYYLSGTKIKIILKNDEFLKTARTRIVSLLYESAGQGIIQLKQDPKKLALMIHSIVLGCAIIAISEKRREVFKEQKKTAHEAVEKLLK